MTDDGGGASRSTDPAAGTSAATDVSLREYIEALRRADVALAVERDRRYTEVQIERDKAEVLRAANQAYRDEKANELREQLARERAEYASKGDLQSAIETITATLKPIVEYVAGQQGGRQGALDQRTALQWGLTVVAFIVAIYFAFN